MDAINLDIATCDITNSILKDIDNEEWWILPVLLAACCGKFNYYSDGSWSVGWDCNCLSLVNPGSGNGVSVYAKDGKIHHNITSIKFIPIATSTPIKIQNISLN